MKDIFQELIAPYDVPLEQRTSLWSEIKNYYTKKNRHYHSLNHLKDLHEQLLSVKHQIQNWETSLFSLFYHDIIYQATKSNNEEKSADLAEKRMREMGIPEKSISLCKAQILATKTHHKNPDSDTNYFTDADLSILGRDWDTYSDYCQKIRKEYAIYPTFMYRKGRKKVVQHFLSMDQIFKTEEFSQTYEAQAISNLRRELGDLS